MVKLIFDDWSWRCENCKSMMALPGIVPSLEMLKERSSKTLGVYEYQIKRMMKWVNIPVQDLTIFHLRSYLNHEKDRGLSNETLEGVRQVLSAYFNWLHREGLILRNYRPVRNRNGELQ